MAVIKYRYARVKRNFVLVFCLFSIFVVVANIIGMSRHAYVSVSNFFIVIFSFLGTILTTIYLIIGYKQFNRKKHRRLVKELKAKPRCQFPSVDIFLPCAGEELEILERTYQKVNKIDYPKKLISTYVLDDKGNDKVKLLAKKYKFNYLSRPNKGEFKKAGNLKYGYEHSDSKYILILDADFAPKSTILFELLPYLERDEGAGIVQSPQDFIINKKESSFVQKGDIGIQEFFYRICQVARNSFDATICTGTNAIYKRSALQVAGGFYQIEHSEDSHTGLSLLKYGFRTYYVPLILAEGYCPSNYSALFKQRSRWCQGSLTLIKSKLFRETKLSPMAIFCHLSGAYYYISSFIIILLPFHTLFLLSTPEKATFVDSIFFLPNALYILASFTIFYYPRFSFSVLGNQFFFYWTYLFVTIKLFIFRQNEAWTPTGAKQSKNFSYKFLLTIIFLYISTYWLWLLSILKNSHSLVLNDYILYFWVIFNTVTHISFIAGLVIPWVFKIKTFKGKMGFVFTNLSPYRRGYAYFPSIWILRLMSGKLLSK